MNDRNFSRLSKLLDSTDGKISFGGSSDASERFMGLTVVTDVGPGDSLMSEELFGPILPIITVESVEEAIKSVFFFCCCCLVSVSHLIFIQVSHEEVQNLKISLTFDFTQKCQ